MADSSAELQKTRDEVSRLVKNWQALLDALPLMVFLVREDFVIEYQNPIAIDQFGDQRTQKCSDELRRTLGDSPFVNIGEPANLSRELNEITINDVVVEYAVVPFASSTEERLVLLIMQDITHRKQYEEELVHFNDNIEEILQQKISDLEESEETRKRLSSQINSLKLKLGYRDSADRMVGSSKALQDLREMVHQVAKSDATILITGESGTGKELVADLVHALSNRDNRKFLKINCSAINDDILESDLFGYEKGAFTGAVASTKGKFEAVDGGTIFLDEIGDISPRMQASLLRILQNGELVRVGGTVPLKIDVRIIAATNVDLVEAVREKRFRQDLFYRLNTITLNIPPLRDRKEDIAELAPHFVRHYRKAFKKDIDNLPYSIIHRLIEHDWPGNVRELENVIQRAVLIAKSNTITEDDLQFDRSFVQDLSDSIPVEIESKIGTLPLKGMLAEYEAEILKKALEKRSGNVTQVASDLQIGKTALYDKLKRYGISAKKMKKN